MINGFEVSLVLLNNPSRFLFRHYKMATFWWMKNIDNWSRNGLEMEFNVSFSN